MRKALVVISVLTCMACDQGVAPPPPHLPDLITFSNVDSISIQFVDYDRLRIKHLFGSRVRSREFRKVGLGLLDSTGYRELLSSNSEYDPSIDVFSFDFDFTVSLDSSRTATSIAIRYYHRASGFIDVDTTVLQYKYPYVNAEIFLTDSIWPGRVFQDIDFLGNKFYFHPTGPEGLYEYDLSTNVTRSLVVYLGGDHIAADSIFVFCDIYHYFIRRYNTVTNTVDLTIATFPPSYTILGLDTYQGFLYAIVYGPPHGFRKYTYDGTLVDSLTFTGPAFHLTIGNGTLYTADYLTRTIRRINLATFSVLPSVRAPARDMEGIRIFNGRLYFCDWFKRIVGSVPVQNLN